MNIPQELRYTKEHEWARLEGDVVYVGITDYAQGELGEIVFVDVDTVSDLMLPIEGEILELNPELEESPELVNSDPYGKGWIVKVKPANAEDLDGLLSADDYKALIAG